METGKAKLFSLSKGEAWWEGYWEIGLQSQIKNLELLEEVLEKEKKPLKIEDESKEGPIEKNNCRIFLVHGHDEGSLHEIARYLEKLELNVVILREQPNQGRVIIEKFEEYADVEYAVVLMTGDDRGASKNVLYENQNLRARQNVIFEMGYFIGKLGRERVFVLYSQDIEIMSDYFGVLYTPLDKQGAWRIKLAQELQAAGLPVDINQGLK
jgi:predicted nucleotide-binding protein